MMLYTSYNNSSMLKQYSLPGVTTSLHICYHWKRALQGCPKDSYKPCLDIANAKCGFSRLLKSEIYSIEGRSFTIGSPPLQHSGL